MGRLRGFGSTGAAHFFAAFLFVCTPIGLSGPVEGVGTAGTAAMPACKDIRNFPKSSKFRTISHTKAVRDGVHVGDRGAGLHRGGRHRGRATAAGVSDCPNLYASRAPLPLRRDGHTKVYAGDQKRLCDRTHV